MAMPDNSLSSSPVTSPLLGGRGLDVTATEDKEDGGIALNDPSQGLQVQVWTTRIIGGEHIVTNAPAAAETTLYSSPSGPGALTEVSLTFDTNMRATFAFVEDGEAKFRWFDTVAGNFTITNFGAGVTNPRVALDDKRRKQTSIADVILAYFREGNLYHRLQRDRYEVEYLLASDVEGVLHKIGMGTNGRFQFDVRIPWSPERIVQETLAIAADASTTFTNPIPTVVPTIITPSSPTIWDQDNEDE